MEPPKPKRPPAGPAEGRHPPVPRPGLGGGPAARPSAAAQPTASPAKGRQAISGTAFMGAEPAAQIPDQGEAPLTSRKLPNRMLALGLAAELLHTRPPFSNFKFGKLTGVIRGQIKRGHYLFTFRGNRPVGYVGWAECDRKVAQAWMERGYTPTYKECTGGDSCVLITFVSPGRAVTFHQIRQARLLYPDRPIYFMREYADGRKRKATVLNRLFDRAKRP
jgi:hemolysin-activating ACP:hemolysin acyltransferase